MGVVLGEDDRLADLVAVVDLDAVGHENVQHFTDRILVEDPLVERGGGDALRQLAVLIFKGVLVDLLFFLGQIVVHDALLDEFQRGLHGQEIHQIAVLHGLRQLVAVSRHAVFQIEDLIGVLVDLVLWRGGEAYQRRVEVSKDILVFVVDGAVRLVADHKIEMPDGEELALLILHGVDAVHHGLIGGEHTARLVIVFLLTEIRHREVGQEIDEIALGLRDEGVAVGQEQDVFDPALIHQHLDERDDRARLAGAGSHDQQRLAAVLLPKAVTDCLDSRLLVIASGDLLIHHDVLEAAPCALEIEELFEVPLGIDRRDPALRVLVVHDNVWNTTGRRPCFCSMRSA